jgi:hypothetical protein
MLCTTAFFTFSNCLMLLLAGWKGKALEGTQEGTKGGANNTACGRAFKDMPLVPSLCFWPSVLQLDRVLSEISPTAAKLQMLC